MKLPLVVIAPAVLGVITVGYIFGNPVRSSSGEQAPATVGTATATAPPATSTPSAPSTDPLGSRLSGKLTYRTADELVTVQFPAGDEVTHVPVPPANEEVSADGEWRARSDCTEHGCSFQLTGADGAPRTFDAGAGAELRWSPTGHALAVKAYLGPGGSDLEVIEDPGADEPRVIAGSDMPRAVRARQVGGFAWTADGDGLIAAIGDAGGGVLVKLGLEGEEDSLAKLSGLPPFLYASPDGGRYAYTVDHPLGWRLYVYDAAGRSVIFSGAMGSDGPGGTPVSTRPDVKSPMYIAWSPDGTKLAFGGGFEPPYVMTTVDVASGVAVKTHFAEGYPGEIKWSPDGSRMAVSTYSPDRSRHEVYIVAPASGVARHVFSGCLIVWSPDGRFLASHVEKQPGVWVIDADTGERAQVTSGAASAVRWQP